MNKAFKKLSANELVALQATGVVLIDIRSKEAFAAAHIPGALHIPFNDAFSSWMRVIVASDQPIALISDPQTAVERVAAALVQGGYDQLLGYFNNLAKWREEGHAIETLPLIAVDTLYQEQQNLVIIDVRTEGEWEVAHIARALHIPIPELKGLSLAPQTPIALICKSGNRSSIAASLLKKAGFTMISNVYGGMDAWQRAGLPIVT